MKRKKKENGAVSTIKYTIATMFKMDKPYLVLLLVSMVSMSALPFLNANLVSYVINYAADKKENSFIFTRILIFIGVIVVLESTDAFVYWYRSNHYISLGHKLDVVVAQKTLSLRYEYAESHEVSELRMKANRAGSSLPVAAENTIELFANLIKTIGCAAVFTMFNPIVFLLVVVFTVINYACCRFFQTKTWQNEQKEYPYQRKADHFLTTMLDYIAGKDIRVFNASGLIKEKYSDAEENVYRLQKKTRSYQLFERLVGLLIVVIQLTVIYFMTGREYFEGGAKIGDVIFYVNLILVFSVSFQGIFYRLLDINYRGRRLQDFRDYLNLDEEQVEKETESVDPSSVKIEFRNVWFKYPSSEEYILKDVSFCFDNKTRYAIVGENGSGKTTLIKLLMRFYLPTKGQIFVNGIDYTTINREEYYKLFTAVFQDFNLMAYTVAENIDFSVKQEKDYEKIRSVLERQDALQFIDKHKEKENTYVTQEYSEEGVNFSGGERQKIAIARADFKEAPVFVMDEPTSALDPIAEKKLYDNINTLIKDKMIIIISHRLQSVMLCDRILYIKNGSITENGTHEELIGNNRDYAEMFNLQAKWYDSGLTVNPAAGSL